MKDKNDYQIVMFAWQEGFVAVLTIDKDFSNLVKVQNAPPKVFWLCTRNVSTEISAQVLKRRVLHIQAFPLYPPYDCFEIFR